jgi:hypothetical protein
MLRWAPPGRTRNATATAAAISTPASVAAVALQGVAEVRIAAWEVDMPGSLAMWQIAALAWIVDRP